MGDPIKKIVLANGRTRYRFVVDIGLNPTTGKRRQLTRTFDTKTEARKELVEIRDEVNKATFVPPTELTLDHWLTTWLTSASIDVERATQSNYGHALLPVRDRLGDRKLQELVEEDIDNLVQWMLTSGRRRGGEPGTGLSARTVTLTLGRLRTALNEAVRRKLVTRNVAQYTKIPREARKKAAATKRARKPWTTDEVRTFLDRTRDRRLYAPVLLSLIGMRPAEVCGQLWTDIDLTDGTLRIGPTRTLVDGEIVEKDGKSDNSERTLPLPDPVLSALKEFKRTQAAERLHAGPAYLGNGHVLVDELGHPFRTDKLRREIHKLMTHAGVRKVRPYDARHSCLTYLATSGVPDVIVSAWAGHADLSFTKRTYIHPDPDHLRQAAHQLNTLLSQ